MCAVKGEKEGARASYPVNVPFYCGNWSKYSPEEERFKVPTVKVTIKRNIMDGDTKTNSVTKDLEVIRSFHGSASQVVRIRGTHAREIYPKDNPSCHQLWNVGGRLSNFESISNR